LSIAHAIHPPDGSRYLLRATPLTPVSQSKPARERPPLSRAVRAGNGNADRYGKDGPRDILHDWISSSLAPSQRGEISEAIVPAVPVVHSRFGPIAKVWRPTANVILDPRLNLFDLLDNERMKKPARKTHRGE
jgi:hypothetical protein